jgi:tetratricopeptide (TPR) repeat protein
MRQQRCVSDPYDPEASMANANDTHGTTNDAARARELTARGIDEARSGDHEAAVGSFTEAETVARESGLLDLAAGAAVNRGWALWLAGEKDGSIEAYEEGAQLAREAGDSTRLMLALGNLGIAHTAAGRHEEALFVYEEYLPLVADDPDEEIDAHLNCATALVNLGRYEEANGHLDEAERIAEANKSAAIVTVYLNRGAIRERIGDNDGAFGLYWKAFDTVDEERDPGLFGVVMLTLARAYIRAGEDAHASDCYGEAERAFRYTEERDRLAQALHEHAAALLRVGLVDQALEAWREEEPILREMGDHLALGECLLQQALATRERMSDFSSDVKFTEAAVAFRRAGALERLPELIQAHALWLREHFMDTNAMKRMREVFEALAESPNAAVESRAHALHALMLADAGDHEAAYGAIDQAEAVAGGAGDVEAVTGARARRAYVMARAGEPAEDVKVQLKAAEAHADAEGHGHKGAFAVEAVALEIEERCGEEYAGLLGGPLPEEVDLG